MEFTNSGGARRIGWRPFAAGVMAFLSLSCGLGMAHASGKDKTAIVMAPPPAPDVSISISPASSPAYIAPASISVMVDAFDESYLVTQTKLYKDNVLVASANGDALSVTLSNLAAGTYTLRATATNEAGSTGSTTQAVVIQPAPQLTGSISGSPNPCTIPWGGSTCASTIAWSSNAANAQVFVSLLDNSNMQSFASAQNGSASAPWIDQSGRRFHLKSGTTTLATMDVRGNPTINGSPSVSLTAPSGGQSFTVNNALSLSANASDADDGVQRVEFFVDGGKVGEDTSSPYAMSWTTGALGAHMMKARAFDTRGAYTDSAAASINIVSTVTGGIEGVPAGGDGIYRIVGWACSTGLNQSIDVHVYAGGAAGSGTYVGAYNANAASEPAIASACSASGSNYRFSIPLSETTREQFAGQKIYVHGISPVGGSSSLIGQSGVFAVPSPTRASTFVSQSVPATMVMGQSYAIGVQMKNTGTATWSAADGYKLGSQNPADNGTWGTSRIAVSGSVATGQTAALNATITAPATPGTYNFQWRMLQESVAWFGATTPNVTVTVTPPPPPPPPTTTDSKTEVIEYYDDTTKWVLGQQKKLTVNGIVASETAFNANALPETVKSFGKLRQTLTYNANGTLATVKDGNDNVTTFSNWKRGIPQTIKYPVTPESPTGATESAYVNDNGWIEWVTDENGYKTCYGYDAMGRLGSITYPSEVTTELCDTSTWAQTTQVFEPVAAVEYGIPAGHWRQTVTTGNGKKISYYDALWRPLVTREYDAANVAGTQHFQRFAYDHEGRTTFASYPGTTDALTTGIWTDYDPLGRVTSVGQDTELTPSLQVTTTTYQTGFKTLVTDPKGNATTTSYQTFDQPSYDSPVVINHPEGALTEIYRDVFGKPTTIRRRNLDNSIALPRTYAYNANQELCRTVEPETGATLTGYDAAGNLKWSSAGLAGTTACEANGTSTAVAARRVDRTYDARNRLKTLLFPDGLGNQSWTYTPDGRPDTAVADNGGGNVVTTDYAYNRRRLLTEERMLWGAISWPITYGYNPNGHLSSQTYPNGQAVAYAPNALGQPTQAGTYASGVSYYPNGAIKQFTYGNGIVHTMTQNARQLPSRSTDCIVAGCTAAADKRLDLTYAFDKNANVSQITDNIAGRQTRGMTYDGLDRLKQVTSAMFGTASYAYDVLDNLTQVNVTAGTKARNHFYCYDASWRLGNVKTTSCSGATVVGLSYDVQGNLANKNGQVYNFDYGNRLRGVNGIASYVYDGLGRRVRDYTTASKYSLYSQGGQLIYANDGRTGTATQYVYLGGSLVAFREAVGTTVTVKYQHTDALGSPIAVTDAGKAFLEKTEYEPYGQVVNGTLKDGPGYTGHVLDAATGMNYMQQRYYDPMIGRFLSVDPVTALSSPVAQFNRYRYAANNPYKFIDPDGRVDDDPNHRPGKPVRMPLPPPPPCSAACMRLRRTSDTGGTRSSQTVQPSTNKEKNPLRFGGGCSPTATLSACGTPPPDYIHVSGGIYVVTGGATLTRNGTLFAGGGVAHGTPKSVVSGKFGWSVAVGYLTTPGTATDVDNFVRGATTSVGGYWGLGGAYAYNTTGSAVEVGFGHGGPSLQAVEYMKQVSPSEGEK